MSRTWQMKTTRLLDSFAARLQGFCCCKGIYLSRAVQIQHFSSATPRISIFICKHSNVGPGCNFLYDFSSEYSLKSGDQFNDIFIIQADFLSSLPTAETLSVKANIPGRPWCKTKLSFQLTTEDQINSNLSQHC